MARAGITLVLCVALTALARPVEAQERVTLSADVLLYGDNTEFRNPFREGETLFGAAPRLSLILPLGERVSLELGVFANMRFGSERASELTRPVVALKVRSKRSAFVFGTLDRPRVIDPPGPDRAGPHGLLPPLQRETLAFERPYEAGLQWTSSRPRLRHDVWLSWQQLNTPEHRERFNAGLNAAWVPAVGLTIPVQFHIVHHGGQQFATGPVSDSYAGAAGAAVGWPLYGSTGRLELLGLVSRHVPDRDALDQSRTGRGVFTRASVERSGWRVHLLFWRGKDFVKEEGDPNYLSIRRNGTYYGGVRDYAETGITRYLTPAPQVKIEVSGRLHRVERHYEYSFRVVSVASVRKAWR
jgi:hypothetical protein